MTMPEVLSHLSFTLLLFFILPTGHLACAGRALLLILAGAFSFVNVGGLTLAEYTRSYADELSMVSVLWLLYAGLSQVLNKPVVPLLPQIQFAAVIALAGFILYPAALGLSIVDPYRWGFSPRGLLLAAFASCVLWWALRNYFAMVMTTAATVLFVLDIKTSNNYWDYLIDPLLWLYCCAYLIRLGMGRLWALYRGRAVESAPAYVAREV
ncbi:hypothetical protein F6455_03605 [Proteobacteria bacterium 005FR1]|nr:hypothetical protein [Proteobacteria bacterium 005FR1]